VLQGVVGRITETGRFRGVAMNVEKDPGDENYKATIPSTDR
jgi:hypothetical protein